MKATWSSQLWIMKSQQSFNPELVCTMHLSGKKGKPPQRPFVRKDSAVFLVQQLQLWASHYKWTDRRQEISGTGAIAPDCLTSSDYNVGVTRDSILLRQYINKAPPADKSLKDDKGQKRWPLWFMFHFLP